VPPQLDAERNLQLQSNVTRRLNESALLLELVTPVVIGEVDMSHEGRGVYARAFALVGPVDSVDVPGALDHLKTTVVGGLTTLDDDVMLQHTLPLDRLDAARAVRPIALLAMAAREMQQRFRLPEAT
jgi:hypothetical protein